MGAIYGILGEADSSELRAVGDRLEHRSGCRAEWSPAASLGLGMRGLQAAIGHSKGGTITFDGFVDNRTELAAYLKRPLPAGVTPADDPALILELYALLGADCFQEIAGQFAVALWDQSHRRLLLARDRIGYAPLFFAWARGRFLFASEYKALLAAEGVPARPNRTAIQVIQSTKWVQPGRTCLEDVFPVAPGTWLAVEHGRIHTQRFWDIPIRVQHQEESRHAADLRTAFINTLRRQTAPFERIGVSLSGGLDSAIMAAGVRQVAPEKELHTFSSGYGPDDKELVNAARVAQELGSRHHPLVLDPDDLPGLLPWMVWHMEEPIGREDIAYLYVAAREAARYVDLVLTGFGFDGLFAGLPRHRVAGMAFQLPAFSEPLREFYDYSVRSVEPRSLSGRLLVKLYYRGSEFPAPTVLGALPLPQMSGFRANGPEPLSSFLRQGFLLLPYQSTVERLYSAAGLRFNAHHTDPEFLRAAFSIPDRLKIRGRTQKYILRKACAGMLPHSMLQSGKSFNRLKHDLRLSAVLDQLAQDLLHPRQVAERGLFDANYIEALRRRPNDRPYSRERIYRLWSLLLTEMWSRMYLDGRGAPPAVQPGPVRTLALLEPGPHPAKPGPVQPLPAG